MKPKLEQLFAPVDAASTVFFRVTFGLLMIWDLLYYVLDGRLERLYLNPVFHFKFYGFAWVEVASPAVMRGVFWGLVALAALVTVGLWYRLAAALFALGYGYVFFLDAAAYNNHNYLILLLALLLAFVPAHRAGSLDARRLRAPRTVPAWSVWLLRFQIGVPYFFGGLAKLNHDWMVEAQPMRMWLRTDNLGGTLRFDFFQHPATAYLLSWGGALFDLAVVPLLLWRRTRLPVYLLAAAFHVANANLFHIGVFPWLMICATTLFFPPDWPRRIGLVGRVEGRKKRKTKGKKTKTKKTTGRPAAAAEVPRRRLVLTLLGVWVAIQVLLPLRHFLYPGNVDWTDQAHRFAWRMKLRDKQGTVQLTAVDRASRKMTVLSGAEALLTPRQRRMMTQDPEMIRQFAHFVAHRLRQERGWRDFEVRAITRLSLNARTPQPLIDPEVDLTTQRASLRPKPWLVPLAPAP